MEIYYVLDASAFINGFKLNSNYNFTVPEITAEIKDFESRLMFDMAIDEGMLVIQDVPSKYIICVNDIISKSGDILRLSQPDTKLIALAYMFSDHTPFKLKDLPAQMQQVGLQAVLDNGKRWKRAKQLYKEYGFGSAGEIIKLENQVKLKYADLLNTLSQRQ